MASKKRNSTKLKKFIIWAIIIAIIALMFLSFSTTQHLTEIIVYP